MTTSAVPRRGARPRGVRRELAAGGLLRPRRRRRPGVPAPASRTIAAPPRLGHQQRGLLGASRAQPQLRRDRRLLRRNLATPARMVLAHGAVPARRLFPLPASLPARLWLPGHPPPR